MNNLNYLINLEVQKAIDNNFETLKYLSSGVSRQAYALETGGYNRYKKRLWVIKREINKNHWAGNNETEHNSYKKFMDIIKNKKIRDCFASIPYYSRTERILVMERAYKIAKDCDKKERDSLEKQLYNVITYLEKKGVNLEDMHRANYGMREDGSLIIIDYAYTN